MEVKFIKDHLSYKAGDVEVLEKNLANYLIRVGVCVLNANEQTKPKKEEKPKRKTRTKK